MDSGYDDLLKSVLCKVSCFLYAGFRASAGDPSPCERDYAVGAERILVYEALKYKDTKSMAEIIKILDENPSQIELYKGGRDNLFDYFVGQVMKNTRGKANPVMTKEILHRELDKR